MLLWLLDHINLKKVEIGRLSDAVRHLITILFLNQRRTSNFKQHTQFGAHHGTFNYTQENFKRRLHCSTMQTGVQMQSDDIFII